MKAPSPKNPFFCVPTEELLRAKDDLLIEGGQSLNSIFADCFGDWFIGIPFMGDDVVAKCISNAALGTQNGANLGLKCIRMRLAGPAWRA